MLATVLAVMTLAGGSFPDRYYPAPVPVSGDPGVPLRCPSPQGLSRPAGRYGEFKRLLVRAARHDDQRRFADRALWPELRRFDIGVRRRTERMTTRPARRSFLAAGLRKACGRRVVHRSVAITASLRGSDSASLPVDYFLVERRGRPLVWFVY